MRDCCGFLAVGFLRGRRSERAIATNLAISGSEPDARHPPRLPRGQHRHSCYASHLDRYRRGNASRSIRDIE